MTPEELRVRTKRFAVRLIQLLATLPATDEARIVGRQLVRSATSVGANYRAVCRSRSGPDFVAKLGIVIEEADETAYWLEILVDSGMMRASKLTELRAEAEALTRIFVSSRITARRNARGEPHRQSLITKHKSPIANH